MENLHMSRIRENLDLIKHILEDATCASLAPYPVMPIGSVIKTTSKEIKRAKKEKKPDNRHI